MKYRADIDGLRSVAVLPIVLYHAGVDVLQGGFLGVDIFFVISGFLITSIIQREMAESRFSLLDFYKRRVARIFPALIFMLLAVLLAGCLLMLPVELERLGKATVSTALFASNMYYWFTLDYFSNAAEVDPLLHTWSLGVEEQFYIFYPLLLIGLALLPKISLRNVLIGLIILSIATSVAVDLTFERGSFYLLPARVWQLALGALVAVTLPKFEGNSAGPVLAWLGMAAMALAYVIVRSDMMLPVPWAILASGGAALVIAFAAGTSAGRLLSWRPFVWIGAISYSLYLWHWPIITFWRLETGHHLDLIETVMLCLASIAAASASYYFVEQPFLRRCRDLHACKVVISGIMAIAPIVLFAAYIVQNPTGWRQISPQTAKISAFASYPRSADHAAQFRTGTCFETSYSAPYDYENCPSLAAGNPNIALLGDSHAAQYSATLRERLRPAKLVQLTSSSCPVLLGAEGSNRCRALTNFAYNEFFERDGIDGVIIGSRWTADRVRLLENTLKFLSDRDIPVVVIGSVYEFEDDFPIILARANETGFPQAVESMRLDPGAAHEPKLRELAQKYGASFYSIRDRACTADGCALLTSDGTPLQFDYGHLTRDGADYLLQDFPVADIMVNTRE